MRRRRVAAWLVSLPLMAAGSILAHALAYRWVYPNAQLRLRDLVATGHGYMDRGDFVPMALGAVFAIEAIALTWTLVGTLRRRPSRPVPAAAFALLPVLAFACQEVTERWLASGAFPWWAFGQPTFRAGEMLQIPIGIVVWLIVRLLLRAVRDAGEILWVAAPQPLRTAPLTVWVGSPLTRLTRAVTVRHARPRGPPAALRAT